MTYDTRTNERDFNIPNTIRRNLFTIRSCGTMTKHFVTWNEFDLSSIDKAEKRKLYLENNGYILIDERPGCLTYIKKELRYYENKT